MSWNTFGRSALFAALAAAGWLPWVVVGGPIVGVWNARALYLVATTALYVGGLSRRVEGKVGVIACVALAGGVVAVFARDTAELGLGLAAILGIARGGYLYRSAPARAAVIEVVLLVGGLCFARFLATTSPFSTAIALWGFLLVQSVFFLIRGAEPRVDRRTDPFEEAYRGAMGLLEG